MHPAVGHYIAGVLHGSAVGLVAGWFLNSGYAFAGSTRSGLIFPVAIVMVVTGHWFNRRASKPVAQTVPAQAGE